MLAKKVIRDSIRASSAWRALERHRDDQQGFVLHQAFSEDKQRFEKLSFAFNDLLFDFSKNLITTTTLELLIELARHANLTRRVDALFSGEPVNSSENRPALHTALRRFDGQVLVDERDIMPDIFKVREKMRDMSERLRAGLWLGCTGKPITTVVNLGVGGSDLGPRLVCDAFKHLASVHINVLFVSSIDGNQVVNTLKNLDPETTLFIVSSKSFTTADTMANAETAKLWLQKKLGAEQVLGNHFIGVSACADKMTDFGIRMDNQLPVWDWVGGRYSVWSGIGLSVAISLGMHAFEQFLKGAHQADEHFHRMDLADNVPVIQALVAIWYNNFLDASTQVILPYDHRLHILPSFLQQLEMESNGKGVTLKGEPVDFNTSPIIWGGFGPNAQHAFYQLLHQGTRFVPVEFIAVADNPSVPAKHQRLTLANCIAQSRAFMEGRAVAEGERVSHAEMLRYYPGNKPSTTILLKELTPFSLGSLLAFYEHKVFVQSVIWGTNPFDQWGVELGKELAGQLQRDHSGDGKQIGTYDQSTLGLMKFSKLSER